MRCHIAYAGENGKELPPYYNPMSTDEPGDGYSYPFSRDESGQPVITVIDAVAELTDRDFRDLKPLHSVIDTTRLNGLFEESDGLFHPSRPDSDANSVSITFRYEGCEVTVKKETVHVDPN